MNCNNIFLVIWQRLKHHIFIQTCVYTKSLLFKVKRWQQNPPGYIVTLLLHLLAPTAARLTTALLCLRTGWKPANSLHPGLPRAGKHESWRLESESTPKWLMKRILPIFCCTKCSMSQFSSKCVKAWVACKLSEIDAFIVNSREGRRNFWINDCFRLYFRPLEGEEGGSGCDVLENRPKYACSPRPDEGGDL